MQLWKQLLLGTYRQADMPRRWWNNRAAAAAGMAPVSVLFYHRVADHQPTPWTISTTMFGRQMRWLKNRYDMLSLDEAQRRLRSRVNRRPAVCITFDDGYADNCDQAIPLLLRERIPCTYFVCNHHVETGELFPHDAAAGYDFAPNTIQQLRNMAAAGIEIGAHTRNHVDVAAIDDERVLHDEIVTAGEDLEREIGSPVRYFACPFGMPKNLSNRAFDMAREAGYRGVCSAYGAYNFPLDDPFHLRRIHGDPQMARLKNWATIDPRKIVERSGFEYSAAATAGLSSSETLFDDGTAGQASSGTPAVAALWEEG